MSNEKLEMNKIESSPSVRRSNSYRVALRKSGISKEYIEELDRQLSVNEENQQQAASATANLPKDNTNNEEEKKTLFKRNYRGLQNKRNATLTRKNGDTDESEVTIAISTNSMNSQTVDGKDGFYETGELTNGKANTNRDNYTPKEDNQQHTESSHQSTCGHLLCLLCCCNYCVFLPQSVRSELRSSIHRDSNRSHLLESN